MITLSYPVSEAVLITLNRPEKRNAMNPELIQALFSALEKISQDSKIRVVMLNGNGEHFCAGADIKAMEQAASYSREENILDAKKLASLLYLLYHFPKPTIALVQGAAMGGGLGLMACCDIAIAAENASFCFPEVKLGLTPSVISPYILAAVSERAAKYYFLTAEKFSAKEALEMGLIHHSVEYENLNSKGLEIAEVLLKNSSHAMHEAKKLISSVKHKLISEELLQFTAEHLAMMRSSAF